MAVELRAVTVKPIWAYAICHLGKNLENRGRPPPSTVIGKRVALHSGKMPHPKDKKGWLEIENAAQWMRARGLDGGYSFTHDLLVPKSSAIVALATIPPVFVERSQMKWFMDGKCGWMLQGLFVLPEPVPCSGAQGFWRVREPDARRVLDQQAKHYRPGSPDSLSAGCKCPVMDNGAGRGRGDGQFVMSADCQIHNY